MGIDLIDFAISILSKMSNKDCDLGNRPTSNLSVVINKFPTLVFNIFASFKTKGSFCFPVVTHLVEDWRDFV